MTAQHRINRLFKCWAYCLLLKTGLVIFPPAACAQSALDGFQADANNTVFALAVQPDGKVIVAGDFTTLAGSPHDSIARLNPDGSLDASFAAPLVDGGIHALALQPDGRVLIGGTFSQVGIYLRKNLARLNSDGSVDAGFGASTDALVRTLLVQPDGQILTGGDFGLVNGQVRYYLARLNADGNLDTSFAPVVNGSIFALALQRDFRLLVAGQFSSINGQSRTYVARLLSNGDVDTTFAATLNNFATAIALRSDGKPVIGGFFTQVDGNPAGGIAGLNTDGSIDLSFGAALATGTNSGWAWSVDLQPDGKVFVGGSFDTVNGHNQNNIARLNRNGSLDTNFAADAPGAVYAQALQPDDKLLLGGSFSTVNGVTRHYLARLNADGSLDDTMNRSGDTVRAVAVQGNGKFFVGYGDHLDVARPLRISHYNADGNTSTGTYGNPGELVGAPYAFDARPDDMLLVGGDLGVYDGLVSFNSTPAILFAANGSCESGCSHYANYPLADGRISQLLHQDDDSLVIGGQFSNVVGGLAQPHVAKLTSLSAADSTFDPVVNDDVNSVVVQADGKFVIGGKFTMVNQQSASHLARVDPDGSLDAGFQATANADVDAIALQPDGRLLVAGLFTEINQQSTSHVARLHADGGLDTSFSANVNGPIHSMVLQADGNILVGGEFTQVSGYPRNNVAELKPDGSLDPDFQADANYAVYAVALQPDGKVILGGIFTQVANVARNHIARLSRQAAAFQQLDITAYANGSSQIKWRRSGTTPALAQPPRIWFSVSGDEDTYVYVGTMQHQTGGWILDNFMPPQDNLFYLRVRGKIRSGFRNGSTGFMELTRQFYLTAADFNGDDTVFADGFE